MKVLAALFISLIISFPVIALEVPSNDVAGDPSTGQIPIEGPLTRSPGGPMNGSLNGLYDGMVKYDDVALLVNDNSAVSREIGTYFAMRRGLPVENIINLSVPNQETISPGEFDELARQVKENLSKRGLSDKIQYMVTTKGVPLRVSGSNWRMSSVDSELMLLDSTLEGSIHGSGWIDNPYFESWKPFTRSRFGIRLVTRLDGYTKEEAMRLVDLAEPSLGVRGRALLDTDPTKGYQASGYGIGNYWMVNAHDWLVKNGHESLLDMNNTFRTDWTDTSAYFSWGSNDNNWNMGLLGNGGFESGSGSAPSSWVVEGDVIRTGENPRDGSYCLKMVSDGSAPARAYQELTVDFLDHRHIMDWSYNLVSVSSPGARVYLKGYDGAGNRVLLQEIFNRSGSRSWEAGQRVMENSSSMTVLRLIIELNGAGTAYFDSVGIRVIRPHNRWVPGAIAETCVSTGGRSMSYGTWYGQSLVADLIRDGVTGVKGYVYEPFLSSISHADILFPAYYSSYNLAEAYWMGSEFGSWMDTVLGDPKCAPYLDERADMGFPEYLEPISTFVENGVPHLSIALYNKGKGAIVGGGKVEVFVDGAKLESFDISLGPKELKFLNISTKDRPEMFGPHEFKVVLNSDGAVWEMDPYNNEAVRIVHVNRLPEVHVSVGGEEVRRTEPLNITVSVKDEDGGLSTDLLELKVTDQYGNDRYPAWNCSNEDGRTLKANFTFIPSWNATLGFYNINARYVDREGSFDHELLYSAFKVVNCQPMLMGRPSSSELMRGSNFTLTLEWSDADSPDGNIYVHAATKSSIGETIGPSSEVRTSERTSELSFEIPAHERSRTWELTASAVDRDGAKAEWTGYVHTNNGIPSVEVHGVGAVMSRLNTTMFSFMYLDPEGLPPVRLEAKLAGPEGEGVVDTVLSRQFSVRSGELVEVPVSGSGLAVGNYTFEVIYEDDEYEGGTVRYPGALRVVNVPPVLGRPMVVYTDGEGPPGGSVMRGSSFSIRVPVRDPDGELWDLRVTATISGPNGSFNRELTFESRPDQTLHSRLSVGLDWSVGPYSLILSVADREGGVDGLKVETLVMVDAPAPILISAKAAIDINMSCSLEIVLTPVSGSSIPVSVVATLKDINGTDVGSSNLTSDVSGTIWTAILGVTGIPSSVRLDMIDDIGRVMVLEHILEVTVERPQNDGDDDNGPSDDGQFLYVALALASLIMVFVVLLVMVIVVKKLREPNLKAPPPMALQLGTDALSDLPPGPAALTAGDPAQGLPPAPLPPGRELNDGSSYHKPGSKEQERPRQRAVRPEDREEVHELGPRRPVDAKAAEIPLAPEPIGPEEVPEPVPFEDSQQLNKGEEVGPQVIDVPNTHDNDITGDPGQGVQEGRQGPGGGP